MLEGIAERPSNPPHNGASWLAHVSDAPERSLYEAVGGMPFFVSLVDAFYLRVADDEVLLRLYPEQVDLSAARERLTLFLAQYWGGPTTYSDARGHPRLRMRHGPFRIGMIERDHWLQAMNEALNELSPAPEIRARLDDYFVMAADAMRNVDEATP
jgi:hemoglobin